MTISIIGKDGGAVEGHYVQDGHAIPFSGVLPCALTRSGISEIEIRKARPNELLILAAQSDDRGWHAELMSQAGVDAAGVRIHVEQGLVAEKIAY